MVLYTCAICNFSSNIKSHLNRHLKTLKHKRKEVEQDDKLSCLKKDTKMNTNEHKMNTNDHKMNTNEHNLILNIKNFSCDFCGETFNTLPSKRRHELHYCKQNDSLDKKIKIKDNIIKEKDQQISDLFKKMDFLLNKVGDTNINNTQNIQLNNYGNEDLSHISDGYKTKLLNGPYGMIPKMIEAVHFNDEKPENKNIKLPNKNQKYVQIYKDNKWIYKDKDEALNDLVDSKYMIMDEHYEVLDEGECIGNNIKSRFIKFKKNYDEGDKEILDSIKKECEMVLLNNR